MPSKTAILGIPKPVATDPIAQGADTIGSALDAIENQIVIATDSLAGDATIDQYPANTVSLMRTTTGTNWPGPGLVITARNGGAIFQLWSSTGDTTDIRVRRQLGAGLWYQIAGASTPTATAQGGQAATVPAGASTPVQISFPPGRFTSTPRVTVTTGGTDPKTFASVTSISASGFTAVLYRDTAASPSVQWIAIQGAS